MAWIESHQSLLRHRKTNRACLLLGISRYELIGHLHVMWWWALDNVPSDGDLGDLRDDEIAAAAEWDGDATAWVGALRDAGFLDVGPEGRRLHDWYDYAGKLIDKRAADRERKRRGAINGTPTELRRNSVRVPVEVAGTQPNPTVPGEREKETAAPASPPVRPRRSALPDEAKTLAAELRAELTARGQTVFQRDWGLTSASAAAGLLRQGLTLDDARGLMAWALADPFWGTRVTHGKHLADAAPHWQRRLNAAARGATGPPFQDSPNLAQYLADTEEAETHGGH